MVRVVLWRQQKKRTRKSQVISKTFEHDLAFLIIPEDYWDRDFLFSTWGGGDEERASLLVRSGKRGEALKWGSNRAISGNLVKYAHFPSSVIGEKQKKEEINCCCSVFSREVCLEKKFKMRRLLSQPHSRLLTASSNALDSW